MGRPANDIQPPMSDTSPDVSLSERPMPRFTWEMLEQELIRLAPTSAQREMTPALVSGTRKQSTFLPPAQVLQEVLCLAWIIADETFQSDGPSAGEESEMS